MWKDRMKKVFKHKHNFIMLFVGAVILYSGLMINQLTNDYDGLWIGSFHNAGTAELAAGRWFWQFISRARFGTSADPYTSLITIGLLVIGLLLLFDLWNITNKYVIAIAGFLFISNPTICCELSYRFTAPTYGVAFVLSILAVWCFEKIHKPVLSVVAGSFCIACSMGSYQAYISCTTIAVLTAILIKLSRDVNRREIFVFSGKSIIGGVLGGVSM
ncbi:MAG: glucosyltransferase domain-containing protein [Butyrivibrio sp.]|nr:glucosyltransferase domain-containing protein [Acetatifactor muris]MCM1559386.1 glucosyltransferase domain-containing protein [Butyrivibrio sp.]